MTKEDQILRGPPEVDIPGHKSFSIYVIEALRKGGGEVAQICGNTNERITYNEILQKSINLAVSLRELGVRKGDVVSLCSENRFEFTIAALAVVFVGAINATINIGYTHNEILHALNLAKPKYFFCTPTIAVKIRNITKELKYVERLILFGVDLLVPGLLYNDMIKENIDVDSFRPTDTNGETDTMAILYSSGTTGLPKGVMLTHLNILLVALHLKNKDFAGQNVPIFSIAPWFHAYGFMMNLCILCLNKTVVHLSHFTETAFLKSIQDHKIATTLLVPPIVVFLAKHPSVDKYDLSSLKLIGSGAAPLSKEIIAAVKKRIGVEEVFQGYGMTETTLAVIGNELSGFREGALGLLTAGVTAKVVDMDTGKSLGPNQPGELCFKSLLTMKGYVDDPLATNNIFDKDGFLHTGDIGYYDEDKYFYIIDRLKELIKYKGYQSPGSDVWAWKMMKQWAVHGTYASITLLLALGFRRLCDTDVAPAELEAVLLEHPAVKECGVVGKPDEAAGELPLAFVVKQPNAEVTERDLIHYIASKVSNTKKLRGGVIFINEIPKNPSGKIVRRELKALLNKRVKSKL